MLQSHDCDGDLDQGKDYVDGVESSEECDSVESYDGSICPRDFPSRAKRVVEASSSPEAKNPERDGPDMNTLVSALLQEHDNVVLTNLKFYVVVICKQHLYPYMLFLVYFIHLFPSY